jgi:hypothetical protein
MGIAILFVAARPNPYTRHMTDAVRRGTALPTSAMPLSGKTCVTSSPILSGLPMPCRAHGGYWLPQELQARKEALRKGQMSVTNQLQRLTEAYLQGVIP